MGYCFLLLALAAGLVKAYCGKKSSHAIVGMRDAITISAVRMILCCAIGAFLPLISGASLAVSSPAVLFIAMSCGVCSAGFVVFWLLSVRDTMYMLVEVFVTAGVLIPLLACNIIYGEAISVIDLFGVILLFGGVYFISTGEKKEKGNWSLKGFLFLILAAVFSGGADLSQKIFTNEFPTESALVFNFYTYVFAAAVLICTGLITQLKCKKENASSLGKLKSIWLYVVLMAITLFLNLYFKTRAAVYLDAVVLYPVNQGLAMVLSSIMALVVFKEKLNLKAILGIALTLIGIIIINML